MEIKKKMLVKNKQGLHARPAALFVQTANRFDSDIAVRKGATKINGKSIMGLLMLEIGPGTTIWIEADGPDAQEAVECLEKIVLNELRETI